MNKKKVHGNSEIPGPAQLLYPIVNSVFTPALFRLLNSGSFSPLVWVHLCRCEGG